MRSEWLAFAPAVPAFFAVLTTAYARRRLDGGAQHGWARVSVAMLLAVPLWYIPTITVNGYTAYGFPFPVSLSHLFMGRTTFSGPSIVWLVSWFLDTWFLLEAWWLIRWRRRYKADKSIDYRAHGETSGGRSDAKKTPNVSSRRKRRRA